MLIVVFQFQMTFCTFAAQLTSWFFPLFQLIVYTLQSCSKGLKVCFFVLITVTHDITNSQGFFQPFLSSLFLSLTAFFFLKTNTSFSSKITLFEKSLSVHILCVCLSVLSHSVPSQKSQRNRKFC